MRARGRRGVLEAILAVALGLPAGLAAQQTGGGGGMEETTRRRSDEGGGPYDRLVIRGVTIIDGTGAPPQGPVDIVIEGDRIVRVGGGFGRQPAETQGNTREIDGTGMYVMPGFVDMHAHTGGAGNADDGERDRFPGNRIVHRALHRRARSALLGRYRRGGYQSGEQCHD